MIASMFFSVFQVLKELKSKKIEIIENEYNQLINGRLTANDICLRYKIG